ncbi:MAG TPA: DUF2155 domain-containing protein [Dongiaceae bacterium]|jgi:hypothetical protein
MRALPKLLLAALLTIASAPANANPMKFVVLRGLDKITAHVSTFTAPIDQTVNFGALQITARSCDKRPPEEVPESAAFLEIVEARPGETPQKLFSGWMFASTPALSALENPIYDLWVLDCTNDASVPAGTSP